MSIDQLKQIHQEADQSFPGDPGKALAIAERGVQLAKSVGDTHYLGRFVLQEANALVHMNRIDEAMQLIETYTPQMEKAGHSRVLVGFLNLRAMRESRRSNYVKAIQLLHVAFEEAKALEEPLISANLTCNIGMDLMYLGDYSGALEMLDESIRFWKMIDNPARMGVTYLNLGVVCSKLGHRQTSIDHFEQVLELLLKNPDPRMEVTTRLNLAQEHLYLDQLQPAKEQVEIAQNLAVQFGEELRYAHVLEILSEIDIKEGRWEGAGIYLESAFEIYQNFETLRGMVLTLLRLAESPLLEISEKRERLERALKYAEEIKLLPEQSRAYLLLAELSEKGSNFESASRYWRKAREIDQKIFDQDLERRMTIAQVRSEVSKVRMELEREQIRSQEMESLLKQVEEQRAKAKEESRQKSELLGHSAHDLRGIAAGIYSLLELCQDETDKARLDDMISDAFEYSQHLLNLLQRLIDKAAIEDGKISIEIRPVSLEPILQKLVERWEKDASAKRQTIKKQFAEVPEVLTDPVRIEQIVNNLLSNAVKYCPLGNELGIDLYEAENGVCIRVWDTGPGISDDDQKLLFRPFQRLSAKPTGGEYSIGLGLNLIKEMADRLKLEVSYQNRSGGGSEFVVKF